MTTLRLVGWAVVGGALVGPLAACSSSDTVCDSAGACTSPDGGSEAASRADATHGDARADVHDGSHGDANLGDSRTSDARTGDAPKDVAADSFECDPMQTPKQNACVISDAYGVFVAPTGNDSTGNGSQSSPYATIGAAIAAAGTKRVYACAGSYPAPLSVTTSVAVFGGLACPSSAGSDAAAGGGAAWAYTGALATVAPTSTGVALTVAGVTSAHFEDMAFTAQDANLGDAGVHGAASIAVLVNGSTGVSFTRVTATAGAGVAGANGGAPTSNWCSDAGIGGSPASAGNDYGVCTCKTFGSSTGGQGGGEKEPGQNGASTPDATPSAILGNDGLGGGGSGNINCGGNGHAGANGAPRDGGSQGAFGTLTAAGWAVATAGTGLAGDPGMGGGGGGGTSIISGAGGGAGGCGGSGGLGGAGGGASLAIAVIASQVSYSDVTLVTSNGGNGGSGSVGQTGQAGGPPGVEVGCNGGAGGGGAGGGGGGGGAGGPSVGVGWAGDASLRIDDASVTNAATLPGPSKFSGSGGGAGGPGGEGGAAASTTGAVPGAAGANGPNGVLGAVAPL